VSDTATNTALSTDMQTSSERAASQGALSLVGGSTHSPDGHVRRGASIGSSRSNGVLVPDDSFHPLDVSFDDTLNAVDQFQRRGGKAAFLFDRLSDALVLNIFGYLSLGEVCRLASVSRRFNRLAKSNKLWHKPFLRNFPAADIQHFAQLNPHRLDVLQAHEAARLKTLYRHKAFVEHNGRCRIYYKILYRVWVEAESAVVPSFFQTPSEKAAQERKESNDKKPETGARKLRESGKVLLSTIIKPPSKLPVDEMDPLGVQEIVGRTHFMIVFLGAAGVGKTAIIQRFLCDRFYDSLPETFGAGLSRGSVVVAKRRRHFYLWEVSSLEQFRPLIELLLIRAHAAVIVVDCTREDSIRSAMGFWYSKARASLPRGGIVCFAVTKTDLSDNILDSFEVGGKTLHQFIEDRDCALLDVSARSGANIPELFSILVQGIGVSNSSS